MGQIFLVRHGQASFGSSNYDQLSPHGEVQAGLLGQWLADRAQGIDRVVSGSMVRHRQTAASCMTRAGCGPAPQHWEVDPGFNEYDHDDVLIQHRPDFAEAGEVRRFIARTADGNRVFQQVFQQAMARWMAGQHDAEYRESWPAFRTRCVAALQRVVTTAMASQTTVVFTSGGTIATLCQYVLGMPDANMFTLNWTLVNSGVTKLYYRAALPGAGVGTGAGAPQFAGAEGAPAALLTLGYLNNYAHLEALGAADAVTYR